VFVKEGGQIEESGQISHMGHKSQMGQIYQNMDVMVTNMTYLWLYFM